MSNDTSVLILAAGNQDRFGSDKPLKQLLMAGNETIIFRICRQVKERGYYPTVVTHRSELVPFIEFSWLPIKKHWKLELGVCPKKRRWKVESLLGVDYAWGKKRTIVLLGDVIYQAHVMNRIFDCKAPDMFFGNYAEIFAYSFRYNKMAREMLTKTLRECEVNGDKGTLHSLFRAYIDGFQYDDIEFHKDHSDVFTHVTGDGGWTRDIDAPGDYERFLEEVVKPGKLDDLP